MPPGMTFSMTLHASQTLLIAFSVASQLSPAVFLFSNQRFFYDFSFLFNWSTGKQDILAPDQPYEGPYGQGPPSVHSNQDGGRSYRQGTILVVTV